MAPASSECYDTAVACPFFLPLESLGANGWDPVPRTPLGGIWEGECHAGGGPKRADGECCNYGYARGVCDHFPKDAEADAIRFILNSGNPQLYYVLERDHAPVEHATIDAHSDTRRLLAAQARAFLRGHT